MSKEQRTVSFGAQSMRVLALASLGLLMACAGAPVQTQYYLLRSDVEQQSRGLMPSSTFAMGRIIVAPYIDQPGMVLETAAGEIRPAMHHQWAEPLKEGLQQFLQVEVSAAVGEDVFPVDYSEGDLIFDVRIDQLHGSAQGEAVLVAYWWLRREREITETFQFSERESLRADGYAELARAEKKLLKRLARRIGDSLKEAGR